MARTRGEIRATLIDLGRGGSWAEIKEAHESIRLLHHQAQTWFITAAREFRYDGVDLDHTVDWMCAALLNDAIPESPPGPRLAELFLTNSDRLACDLTAIVDLLVAADTNRFARLVVNHADLDADTSLRLRRTHHIWNPLAADPSTPADLLTEITLDTKAPVTQRRLALKNPSLPEGVFDDVVGGFDFDERLELLTDKALPTERTKRILASADPDERRVFLDAVMKRRDPDLTFVLISDPDVVGMLLGLEPPPAFIYADVTAALGTALATSTDLPDWAAGFIDATYSLAVERRWRPVLWGLFAGALWTSDAQQHVLCEWAAKNPPTLEESRSTHSMYFRRPFAPQRITLPTAAVNTIKVYGNNAGNALGESRSFERERRRFLDRLAVDKNDLAAGFAQHQTPMDASKPGPEGWSFGLQLKRWRLAWRRPYAYGDSAPRRLDQTRAARLIGANTSAATLDAWERDLVPPPPAALKRINRAYNLPQGLVALVAETTHRPPAHLRYPTTVRCEPGRPTSPLWTEFDS